MRLSVDPRTRSVLLTVPRRVSRRRALAWASGHRAWIEAALADIPPALALDPGASVPLHGAPHLIDWDAARPRRIEREAGEGGGRLIAGGPLDGLERRMLRWLKAEALDLLGRETAEFAARAGVTVARIGIGDPISRWGSCSSSGAIRYSWRLICPRFRPPRAGGARGRAPRPPQPWPRIPRLPGAMLGTDPGPARAWLKREGAALHRIGPR